MAGFERIIFARMSEKQIVFCKIYRKFLSL